MSSPVKSAVSIVLIGLLGVPATYFVNTAQTLQGERGLLAAGVTSLLVICGLTYLALASFKQPKDWLFYVFTLSTFSSVVDLIIGLELDGYVSGFMTNYLKDGEPYLATPYGSIICYWDGTVHYALYLIMLTSMAFRWRYRVYGLYWVGSIGHSMLVLIPGAILSKPGTRWSFFLNMPYIVIPIVSAVRFLRERRSETTSKHRVKFVGIEEKPTKLYQRPIDIVCILLSVVSILVSLLRGFAALGSSNPIAAAYVRHFEPYLLDPVGFPKAQMLIYMYYFVPFYVLTVCALVRPGVDWMPDWAVIFAGAAAQAQVSHIVSSLHPRTPAEFQVPTEARTAFWVINIGLLVVPHLLALRCWVFPSFFSTPTSSGTENRDGPTTSGSQPRKTKSSDSPRRVKKLE